MHPFRKAAIAFAAVSIIAAPVSAAAADLGGARATSDMTEASDLGGGSGWIIGLVGLLAGVTAAIIIASDDDDAPASP